MFNNFCCKKLEEECTRTDADGVVVRKFGQHYGFYIIESQFVKMNFCPWCGTTLQQEIGKTPKRTSAIGKK